MQIHQGEQRGVLIGIAQCFAVESKHTPKLAPTRVLVCGSHQLARGLAADLPRVGRDRVLRRLVALYPVALSHTWIYLICRYEDRVCCIGVCRNRETQEMTISCLQAFVDGSLQIGGHQARLNQEIQSNLLCWRWHVATAHLDRRKRRVWVHEPNRITPRQAHR